MSLPSNVTVSNHALVASKVSLLRAESSSSVFVRHLVREISLILAVEASGKVFTTKECGTGTSPLGVAFAKIGVEPADMCVVPVLRSGLEMTESFLTILPHNIPVHHIGIYREKSTLSPVEYYNKLPPTDTPPTTAFILDPIIATGGTADATVNILREWGVKRIVFVSILASEPGLRRVSEEHGDIEFIIGAVDGELNEKGYIVPGLGDIGDRLFHTFQ
ncbi:PRTase-like protein [Saitoella complicata NRRL Y-17804]|uniref:uracil phosphoribosyltransferase n=1 Tax=Saitoella complicata (strain BCRC 22490 / CBS 7301 / JCM 7358 / NBRC 10748 / NRRL Y-17804) TaxID=698492 RepID=A0A0E9N7T9_SAICN|nr:PRTase-like protein [Saitoella complicata NRRL Y-17804]ODQ54430.1 PRTase-like protein [Saitoella complicata NRRL Y-17804]GAO45889.1 hypothetical protein G7K_0135-t1 [Saitoella complicata NRRL Y-17804]